MTAAAKRQLVIVRRSPYGTSLARTALDVALAAATFDQPVSVLFLGEGVLQLIPDQDSRAIDSKSVAKLITSLPLYDIDKIHVDTEALARYGIETNALPDFAECVDTARIQQLMAAQRHILAY